MKFPPFTLEIGDDEGFSKEKDIFERKPLGDSIKNILAASEEPLVIALDGQWGCGKSTFLKMLSGELRKEHFPVVYFDAFENDYISDAFIALAGEIVAVAGENNETRKKLIDATIKVGRILLRSALKIGVRMATAGAMSGGDLKDISSDISDETSELTDKYIGELITKRTEQKHDLNSFKIILEELPKQLSENAKPLVIIIDELDRCKPTFALDLLERVKHLFSVNNVHFIFGVNLRQLENSVKVAYGSEIDAHTYLQKFISFGLHFSEPEAGFTKSKFIAYLKKTMELDKINKNTNFYQQLNCLSDVDTKNGLSFRQIEKIITLLTIFNISNKHSEKYNFIVVGLIILKVISPALFKKAITRELQYSEIDTVFDIIKETQWENIWRYYTERFLSDELLKKYRPKSNCNINTRFYDLSEAAKLIDAFNFSGQ